MKKQFIYKPFWLTILLVFVAAFAFSQNYETSKSLNKSVLVSANAKIILSNYSDALKITTSNDNIVKMVTSIEISGKEKTDVDQVIAAIDNFEFTNSGNTVTINTRFYKNMQSINNRRTITLRNGNKVRIKEFTINHELQIPKTAKLKLDNKYSDIEIDSPLREANLKLYSSKISTANFSDKLTIEAKYSKIYLKEIGGNLDLDIYDSDVEFTSANEVSIKSKYSKINAKKVAGLMLDSYDDKFFIDEISNLKFAAKYSDLVSKAIITNLTLDLYDSNLEIKSAKTGTFTGKYSDLKLGDVKEMKITGSHDNNIDFGKTMDIEIAESKYSEYKFAEIARLKMDGYDDNILISGLNSEFSGIAMSGKYGKLEVLTRNIPYQLHFKMMYGKIDIPQSVTTIKHIEKNGELELVANNSGGLIAVDGYDMKVVIK